MQLQNNAAVKIEIYTNQVDCSKIDWKKWKPDSGKFPAEIVQKSAFASGT